MRYLTLPFVAALLASPIAAFDICSVLKCYGSTDSPSVSVTLNVPIKSPFSQPTVRVDLYQSLKVCDPSSVQVFTQPLAIDENGRGNGSIMLTPEVWVKASWEFTCITPKDASKEHKLRFTIHAINDEEVPDTEFVTRFRQTWPVIFTSVESESLAAQPEFSRGTLHYLPEEGPDAYASTPEEL
ncbi:hypothetical protein ACHAPT_010960 [Fusarium lateritium]